MVVTFDTYTVPQLPAPTQELRAKHRIQAHEMSAIPHKGARLQPCVKCDTITLSTQ